MGLFQKATNQTAYLKSGFLGFEGAGKTRTAFELLAGLCKRTGSTTLAFFDTEKSSDFFVTPDGKLRPEYAKRFPGLQLLAIKSRSFTDLLEAIREAEREKFGGLIIDSVTHVWKELMESWLRKKGRSYLEISDWGKLKNEWATFTTSYINSRLHIAMLGRAGDEYDNYLDENGSEKMVKSGTKMKVEKETGFEPDLLVEMFKEASMVDTAGAKDQQKGKKRLKNQGFVNKAMILKDRNGVLNGQVFTFTGPNAVDTFTAFKPVIDLLALGKEHVGVDTSRTSDSLFAGEGQDKSYFEMKRQHEIAQEEIKQVFILENLSGTGKKEEKERTELLISAFGTSSWTAITSMKLAEIQGGLQKLKGLLDQRRVKEMGVETPPAAAATAETPKEKKGDDQLALQS